EEEAEVQEKLKKLDGDGNDGEDYLKYSRMAKTIANTLTRLNKRRSELNEYKAKENKEKGMKHILLYTHNALPAPDPAKLIKDFAVAYYKYMVNNAFGRKHDIIIQAERLSIYEEKAASFNFNVIVGEQLDAASRSYKKTSNDIIPITLERLQQNRLFDYDLEKKPLNVVITGGNMYTYFAMDPLKDASDSLLAALSVGTLWDVQKLAQLYNSRMVTESIKTMVKASVNSSVDELSISQNGNIAHTLISDRKLRQYRVADDKEEWASFAKKRRGMQKQNLNDTYKNIGEKRELALRALKSKRPSELKPEELSELNMEFIKSLIPYYKEKQDKPADKIKIALITDIHIGNYADLDLLSKACNDAAARKPDIVVLGGDIFDGRGWDYKEVLRNGAEKDYPEKYMNAMKKQGFSEERIKNEMLNYYENRWTKVVHNVDEQPGLFFKKAVWELIDSTVLSGGAIVIVSGNHDNNGNNDKWYSDEAEKLKHMIIAHLEAHEEDGRTLDAPNWRSNIKAFPGGEWGAGEFNIGDMLDVRAAHETGGATGSRISSAAERYRSNDKLTIGGHIHKFSVTAIGDKVIITGSSMQDNEDNPYLSRIGMASANDLKGYTYMEVEAKGNSILEIKTQPVLKRELTGASDLKEIKKMLRDDIRTVELSTSKEKK
ncbi:MAG: metallophosphoesterase, partial [Candidatus Micrarchaeaceae archaeon]